MNISKRVRDGGSDAQRPTLLIVSFSRIVADARLLKQIRAFTPDYEVTTCGYGPQPDENVAHIEIDDAVSTQLKQLQGIALRARLYRFAYWVSPQARQARRLLRSATFDAVLANDLDTAGAVLAVFESRRIHLDLHEFWPGRHDDVAEWTALRAPFYSWQLRKWATQARSVTTINESLAERYSDDFGLRCGVVTNATEFQELAPGSVKQPIRFVHSGASQVNRRLERMMRAVARSTTGATIDLYLVGTGSAYYRSLQDLARDLGERVRILPPVSHADLVSTLNQYDVGLPFLPPTTTNIRMSLPNKFFDYVQARLAILTGPTPPMKELVEKFDLGVVTADFEEESLVRAIETLDVERIQSWKRNADAAAEPLSAERQNAGWLEPISHIAEETRQR
ncbi:glycosyltransferase [Leucobacter manosquensis]|uniref:Glycosyltransferase family 1 protein n=1 Tax=Leucobacter manosquensis TaxID=2810611 RepID=A0ABS5M5X1_9MICO|nr:glycosyltransferase [Leucobacter manosquensis]MBS3182056.1 glycosyltransferase family 1 protein [Leucobacter manosquensis]